jgi:hypothetical protein
MIHLNDKVSVKIVEPSTDLDFKIKELELSAYRQEKTSIAAIDPIKRRFFKAGKLIGYPSRRALQIEVLESMACLFKPSHLYKEIEINELLKAAIEFRDHVFFRRELIDLGILKREKHGKVYWLNSEYKRPLSIGRMQEEI